MSAHIKITENGDIDFDPITRSVNPIFDIEAGVQLAIHTISFDTRPDGKGAGLKQVIGKTTGDFLFEARIVSFIENAFSNVISAQYNTPSITKTRKELISEVRDIIVSRRVDDPRNYDIELTVVFLSGETFDLSGVIQR